DARIKDYPDEISWVLSTQPITIKSLAESEQFKAIRTLFARHLENWRFLRSVNPIDIHRNIFIEGAAMLQRSIGPIPLNNNPLVECITDPQLDSINKYIESQEPAREYLLGCSQMARINSDINFTLEHAKSKVRHSHTPFYLFCSYVFLS